MIQRRTRDYEVSLWSLQDSLIAILKQYGLEFKGQIEEGKLTDKDDGTQTFSFKIPMYYYKDGEKIENPSWYNVASGKLIANMRKVKVIFNKDDLLNRKIYEFLIVKVSELHNDDNSLYCSVECEGLAFHELGKIGYKISLSPEDFYNDDYDYATNNKWIDSTGKLRLDAPLATLNYWNDRVFSTINNWSYEIQMNWDAYSLLHQVQEGVLTDYTIENDKIEFTQKRLPNKVYEDDFVDSWDLVDNKLLPKHITYAREKARVSVDIKESNIYNITQTLAETFGVFCRYEYLYNLNCQIVKRKVVYYNNFLNEALGTIDISYPYQTSSIKRNIDSTDLVTKLFVKSVDDPNSGALSIIDVGANDMGEDYILNFDYLHEIGGITDEQYAAVEEYKVKIKRLNQEIAPVSAKVISLQSQLVKLEAELTTRKNAIAQDTEQLLSNNALLDAITNGNDVLSVSKENPQTATLIEDTSDTVNHSYYIKITQQGVYPETIQLYRTYKYQTQTLLLPLTTGEIVFDDMGEVVRIKNLYPGNNNVKTVYIIYSYRPKLYYERVVAVWQDRLNNDRVQRDILANKIAQIKYSLYGEDQVSQEELKNMDVTNLFDLRIYDKYQSLLQEKQNTIKLFNAMMGPALREGYWQPENYNDYGDQYNDRFNISLNPIPDLGSTKNTVFKWDDELFEGEQDVFYHVSAAEYEQAYPCIDLTTPTGKQILKLITTSETPISYIYTPRMVSEDQKEPKEEVNISGMPTELIYISGLIDLDWNELSTITDNDTTLHKTLLAQWKSNYLSKINAFISGETWGHGYTSFSYHLLNSTAKNTDDGELLLTYTPNELHTGHKIDKYSEWFRLQDNDPTTYQSPYAEFNSELPLDIKGKPFKIRLTASNGYNTPPPYAVTIVRPVIDEYTISRAATKNRNSTILVGNKNKEETKVLCEYNITSKIKLLDLSANLYTWIIKQGQNDNLPLKISHIYPLTLTTKNVLINNKSVTFSFSATSDGYFTLTFDNEADFITLNTLLHISFQVQTPNNLLNGGDASITAEGEDYVIKGNNGAPIINTHTGVGEFVLPNIVQCTFSASASILKLKDGASFSAVWYINDQQVQSNQVQSNDDIIYTQTSELSADYKTYTTTLTITINKVQGDLSTLSEQELTVQIIYDGKSDLLSFGTIKIDRQITLTWPQDFELTNTLSLLENPNTILLQLNSYNYNINIQNTINATQFLWIITPNNSLQDIHLIASSTQAQTSNDERYSVSLITEDNIIIGSQLSIQIPRMDDNNNLRDNGTQIKCICSNSADELVFPEEGYKTLQVAYPMILLEIPTTVNWWPMPVAKSLGNIIFSVPKSVINDELSPLELFTINPNIYILRNDQLVENGFKNADVEFFTTVIRDDALSTTNKVFYQVQLSGQVNAPMSDSTEVNTWLENNFTENDTIKVAIEILLKTNSNVTVSGSFNINRCSSEPQIQNGSSTSGNIYQNNNDMITIQYNNATLKNANNTLAQPVQLKVHDILDLNIDSVQSITWKYAGNTSGLRWFDIDDLQINITRLKALGNLSSTTGVTQYGILNNSLTPQGAINSIVIHGMDQQIYLLASNPYGTIRSKLITFSPLYN